MKLSNFSKQTSNKNIYSPFTLLIKFLVFQWDPRHLQGSRFVYISKFKFCLISNHIFVYIHHKEIAWLNLSRFSTILLQQIKMYFLTIGKTLSLYYNRKDNSSLLCPEFQSTTHSDLMPSTLVLYLLKKTLIHKKWKFKLLNPLDCNIFKTILPRKLLLQECLEKGPSTFIERSDLMSHPDVRTSYAYQSRLRSNINIHLHVDTDIINVNLMVCIYVICRTIKL